MRNLSVAATERFLSFLALSAGKLSACFSLAPLPGYVSNHVPRPGLRLPPDFGACSGHWDHRLDRQLRSSNLGRKDEVPQQVITGIDMR